MRNNILIIKDSKKKIPNYKNKGNNKDEYYLLSFSYSFETKQSID